MKPTTLSMGARGLRAHIAANTDLELDDIGIGHPGASQFGDQGSCTFSLYFYKFTACSSGDDHPQRPLDVVAHCLLTSLARTVNGDTSSAGERDLQALGQVMECLHRYPRLKIVDRDQEQDCEVQVIPSELTNDELNKIVPIQPEGGFRPSVAYQVSLLPLPVELSRSPDPPVQMLTYTLRPDADPTRVPSMADSATVTQPVVEQPDFGSPWVPHLYLLDDRGRAAYAQYIRADQDSLQIRVLPAGPEGASEDLELEARFRSPACLEYSEAQSVPTQVPLKGTVSGLRHAASNASSAIVITLESRQSGQYMLHLIRRVEKQILSSNTCLVTVQRGTAV